MSSDGQFLTLLGIAAALAHLAGFFCAYLAIMTARTSQGAIAWAISLIAMPYLTVPAYLIFGSRKFYGYVNARRQGMLEINHIAEALVEKLPGRKALVHTSSADYHTLEVLAQMPFTRGNDARLLIDGPQAFDAMFRAIDEARDYILVQFYIVCDDEIGREFKAHLLSKLNEGVRVYFLIDAVGSRRLSSRYIRQLQEAGAELHAFSAPRGFPRRLQINFRNHRKVLVIDGRTAFTGGLNIGDSYMGHNKQFGRWRDTQLQVNGPSVQAMQLSFLEDWFWATGDVPPLNWEPQLSARGDMKLLVMPSGPADELETCALFFVHAINSARRRLWIASPYFVPDPAIVSALQLAALRGVDVRIILPEHPDHLMVYLAGFSYLPETIPQGVKVYRYMAGFMHHKIVLIDDEAASVGTANFDNRSFRLNFELTLLCHDQAFAHQVEGMLQRDLDNCRQASIADLEQQPLWFKIAVQVARLMSPVL